MAVLSAPEVSTLGRVKGAAFREFLLFFGQRYGVERMRACVEGLPATMRARFNLRDPAFGVLASRWYAVEVVHVLLDTMTESIVGQEREQLVRDGSAAIMNSTLHGVHRVLFSWMATPERYVKFADRLWSTYHDTGSLASEFIEDGLVHSRICGWRGHHRLICELNSAASKPIYEAMGCREVVVRRVGCVADGASACETEVRWQP